MLCQWVLYNTTLALWKGQRQTDPWYTLHFACRSFQVPSFLQHQCWAWKKGPAVPWWFLTEPPVQGISNLFLPSSCERCCTSTDISHHAANQPERTGHLSCWSLTDQIIETNFRKSQLFPPAPGIVNRTPNPTENNLINKVFIIYRDRMVISVTPSHRFVDVNGQKIPTNSSPEQKCRGQEGEQFHFREG